MIPTAPEASSESWQQLEALYHATLATHGEAREALLAQVDPGLRAKVEVLLANAETEEGKLDRPAWEWDDDRDDSFDAPVAGDPAMLPGDTIGLHRIEAQVGSGGMGVVYRAIDKRLHRQVALKICESEFTNRFEREARVIAR